MAKKNSYKELIAEIFRRRYKPRSSTVPFHREDIPAAAKKLGIKLPKNLGDVIYSLRFRTDFPRAVAQKAPKGKTWVIELAGRSKYKFVAKKLARIVPRDGMVATKIPDATPGIIEKYALSDEQALLAKLRYNRLVDIFTGVASYSLQNHLRTTVHGMGQVETDEIYIGVDRRGAHYIFPIQAKGGKDQLSIVQIEQDLALCKQKFSNLICIPIAAQFLGTDTIVLFGFEEVDKTPKITVERHYQLVPEDQVTDKDITAYRTRSPKT